MSLAEGCGLRRGHESGHAANVRVYFQSLEAYWVDDAPERHPDVTCPECGALDTKCAMCGGTGAVTHSQWVQWGEEE